MSSSAFAALTVEQREYPRWTDPEIVQEPVFDGVAEYSIYNLGTQGFLCGANNWTTRASVVSNADASGTLNPVNNYRWRVNVENAEEGLYRLKDYMTSRTPNWQSMFADGEASIWVDNDNGANVAKWQLTVSEGVYTISNAAFPGKVLAAKVGDSDTRAYLVTPGTEGYNSEWIFTTPDVSFLPTTRTGATLVTHNNEVAVWNASQALWKLMVEAEGAKNALSQLPVSQNDGEGIQKYLTQVGDFASFSIGKLSRNETLSKDNKSALKKLSEYADNIAPKIEELSAKFGDGEENIGNAVALKSNFGSDTEPNQKSSFDNSFLTVSKSFVDYPSLIYDGPFADSVQQKKPKLTEKAKEYSAEQARKILADFVNRDYREITYREKRKGVLPVYVFDSDNLYGTDGSGLPHSLFQRNSHEAPARDSAADVFGGTGN